MSIKKELTKNRLIIIGCSPRSGSSWLMRIINSSNDIYLYPEPDDKGGKCECELYLLDKEIQKDVDSDQLRGLLTKGICRINRMDPTVFTSRFDRNMFQFFFKKYFYRPKLVGFKTIYSPYRLGWMRKELNYPKTIWLIRNPYGHCLSRIHLAEMIQSSFKARINRREKQDEFRDEEYENDLIKFAKIWRQENESAILENQKDENFKIVIYEKLCEEPFMVASGIFEFLGVNYDKKVDTCIQKTVLSSSSKNPLLNIISKGYFSTTKDPLESAYKWKRNISKTQKQAILEVVRDSFLMKYFKKYL